MKRRITAIICTALLILLTACSSKQTSADKGNAISFTDDAGTKIELKAPAKRIISLYSAHTENLYSLGLSDEIVGVGKSETYPKEVASKKSFDYKGDAEALIKEKPEVVLMRPTITKSYPDFVKSLQNAGIQVVSIYPENLKDFDKYIETLGLITGKEKEAKAKLEDFHKQLDELKIKADKITNKKKVFLETMGTDLKTATKDSLAWNSIELAGAINIADDAKADKNSGTIAAYGQEKLLAKADEIDAYIAQKGGNNPSVTEDIIKKRPGFNKIKAIKDNKVFIIDEKLISSPTFRYIEGIKELQKDLYSN